jgi:hypothetical protein
MPPFTRYRVRLVACTLLAAAVPATAMAVGATAQAVTAHPASHRHAPQAPAVSVSLNQNTPFAISPNPRPAGPVTFRVSSGDGADHWFSGLVFNPGVTPQQAIQEIQQSFSPDPAVALPALKAVYRDITFAGGLSVTSSSPSWFTENLSPGAYQMSDAPPASEDGPSAARYTSLQVNDPWQPAAWPHFGAVLSVRENGGSATFLAPDRLSAHGTFLAVNPRRNAQPYEFLLRQLNPGTTHAQLQAYLTAKGQGQPLPPSPFATDEQQGLLPISPGLASVFHADFTPGTYALLTYVRDPATGVGRAYEGTFKIITLY